MTPAEVAQVAADYRELAYSLRDDLANGEVPLDIAIVFSRKQVARWAEICKHAALAEEIHPDKLPVKCHVCGGTEACDILAHLLRTTFTSRTDR